jgi:CDP-diacylglycerol--glycerol-3-phosphate 3-phosphatidyltransferase
VSPAARVRAPVTAAGLLVAAGGALALREPGFAAPAAATWLIAAAGLWAPAAAAEPVGAATAVTLGRGLLVALVAGFLAVAPGVGALAWAPGLLYAAAALADLVDGYLARRLGQVSALGSRLDVTADALGLLVAPAVAVRWARLPAWYLLLGAAYYLFLAGLWLRARVGLPVRADHLRPSRHARAFAGCQMGLTVAALLPVLPPRAPAITAAVFMVPTLALFGRDWLLATGRLERDGWAHARLLALAARLTQGRALAFARLAVAGVLLASRPQLALPAAALAIGAAPRLAAFAIAVALGFALDGPTAIAAFTGASLIMVLGPGRIALWTPEERFLFTRLGERV